jgi:hypothetical protein
MRRPFTADRRKRDALPPSSDLVFVDLISLV